MSAREAFEKYKIEINSHDFEHLVPLISEECDFWHPTGTYHGMAQVRQGFEKVWEAIANKKTEFSKADWIVESDRTSVCTYTFYYSGVVSEQKIYEKGHGTTCFHLEQGGWKVFHEHISLSPD